jgi:hypothetical protein
MDDQVIATGLNFDPIASHGNSFLRQVLIVDGPAVAGSGRCRIGRIFTRQRR